MPTQWLKENITLGNILTVILLVVSLTLGWATIDQASNEAKVQAQEAKTQARAVKVEVEKVREDCVIDRRNVASQMAKAEVKFAIIEGSLYRLNENQERMERQMRTNQETVDKQLEQINKSLNRLLRARD
jgi:TolA-binding protein